MLNIFNLNGAKLQYLYQPTGSLGINEFIVPNTIPTAVQLIESAQLYMGFIMEQGIAGPQNIPNTSTVPVYAYIQYWVADSTDAFYGKWLIDQTEANAVAYSNNAAAPDTLYDGKDPALQRACVIVKDEYFFWQIKNYKFKNRSVYREEDGLLLTDASKLLASPGYFKVGFYFASYDGRKVLGAGVTDTIITERFAIQNFVCTGTASLGL